MQTSNALMTNYAEAAATLKHATVVETHISFNARAL
jgi:hypothetical protein